MDPIRLSPETVRTRLPEDDVDPAERIAQLEHLLALERARREAIEAGIDRLSERCHALARENAALRERLGTPV
jgi:regulator of replication initiation timing